MTQRKQGLMTWFLAGFLFSFWICQFSPTAVVAQDEGTGSYGAAYLKIPVGPTLMSVPDVLAGMDPDASLAFSNPAGLSHLTRGCAFFSRAAWLDELSLNAASVVLPVARYDMGFSLGTRLLQAGTLLGYDSNDRVVSEESYYGLAISGALSKRFSPLGLSLGVGLNYLRERLPGETGDGLSMSVGASYENGAHHVDVFAQDLGGEISFEGRDYPLDSRVVVGYGYAFVQSWGRLDVGTQFAVCRSDMERLQFGAAYHFPRFFVLRGGLDRPFDSPTTTQLPLSAGLGVRYGTFMLDYAFTPQEYFENTHTFSIGVSFGHGGASHRGSAPGAAGARTTGPATPQGATPMTEDLSVPLSGTATRPTSPAAVPSQGASAQEPALTKYLIVAGLHARAESARAEARALQLVKVPAIVEERQGGFGVLVGRYDTRKAAEKALASYERQGHRFQIVPEAL